MTVHLTPDLEQLVQNQIDTGRFQSADAVIGEALRLMQEQSDRVSRKSSIHHQIAEGYASLRDGEGVDGEEFFAELEQEENKRFAKQQSA